MNKSLKQLLAGAIAPAFCRRCREPCRERPDRRSSSGSGWPRTIRRGWAARLGELIEKKSGGKLKVKVCYSGSIGDDVRMVSALKGGVQEMSIPSTAPLVGDIEEFGVLDLPFMFNDERRPTRCSTGRSREALEKLPAKGLIGLCYWENGFRQLTNGSARSPARRTSRA